MRQQNTQSMCQFQRHQKFKTKRQNVHGRVRLIITIHASIDPFIIFNLFSYYLFIYLLYFVYAYCSCTSPLTTRTMPIAVHTITHEKRQLKKHTSKKRWFCFSCCLFFLFLLRVQLFTVLYLENRPNVVRRRRNRTKEMIYGAPTKNKNNVFKIK